MQAASSSAQSAPVIVVVDYGAGNLRSIGRALQGVGARVALVRSPEEAGRFDGIVLPGVGAFGAAMERLHRGGFADWIHAQVESATPLVGVCLGMQLLYERSEEGGDVAGLGLLPGEVRRLPAGLKIPHMGWNQLTFRRREWGGGTIADGAFVYFVHSYFAIPRDDTDVIATTFYGTEFPAIIQHNRLLGLQFHPEKSGQTGQQLLRNTVAWVAGLSGDRTRVSV